MKASTAQDKDFQEFQRQLQMLKEQASERLAGGGEPELARVRHCGCIWATSVREAWRSGQSKVI